MKKIINWSFGAFFRTLGRVFGYLSIAILIMSIFSKLGFELPHWFALNVNASTITSYDTYKNFQNGSTSCGTSGKYSYTTTLPNVQGGNFWETGNLNTTISGKAHDIALSFNSTLLANTYYDITINFMSNDLRYNVKRENLTLFSGSSCQDLGTNNLALVSFTNTATSNKNTNKLKLRVYSSTVNNFWTILLSATDNQFLTSVKNFGIKNIDIVQIEDNSTEDIINNQTNNTENIINNSNANTDKIESTIKDNLNSCRDSVNLFNMYNLNSFTSSNITYSNNSFTVTGVAGNNKAARYIITLQAGTYILSGTATGAVDFVEFYRDGTWDGTINLNTPFTLNKTTEVMMYFYGSTKRNTTSNTSTFTNIQLQKGSNATSYEEYGKEICNNKLDDVNQSIQDTNDFLNNNDISDAEDSAGGFFSNFNTNTHGLTGIITAPLNAIQSLTSKTCSPLVLPLPYVDKYLTLPCMREIYVENFGPFMQIYDVISLGIISYWVMVRIFTLVKDFKNPDHDEIEVMDL